MVEDHSGVGDSERGSLVLPLTTRFDSTAMRTNHSLIRRGDGEFSEIDSPLALASNWLDKKGNSAIPERISDPEKLDVALCIDSRGGNASVAEAIGAFLDDIHQRGARVCAFVGNRAHSSAAKILEHVSEWTAASGDTSFLWHPPSPSKKFLDSHISTTHWLGRLLLRQRMSSLQCQSTRNMVAFFERNLPEKGAGSDRVRDAAAAMLKNSSKELQVSARELADWQFGPLVRVCENCHEFAKRLQGFIRPANGRLPPQLENFVSEVAVAESVAKKHHRRVRVEFIDDNVLVVVGDDLSPDQRKTIHSHVASLLPNRSILMTSYSMSRH
jgi:hypothetical protein